MKDNQEGGKKSVGLEKLVMEAGLKQLLDHDFQCAKRYRHFISLAMIVSCSERISPSQVMRMTKEIFRESDELFYLGDRIVILMNHTDAQDGVKALLRLRNYYNSNFDVRYALASYPDDGGSSSVFTNSTAFLEMAELRLDRALRGGYGQLVAGA